ncbi:hypothetical protein MY04_4032 [Flammeovirga sp. MY04]|uniref:hypothetical protein n=1 Tax=Flammeovirga sp. MY04 TaxID=1191459 RepID=UPI0008063168|nr:hypothetical protein [Flammeovirga sp. MY04]ANQ51376.1 hypothetical protein MY04_4032 [Flammeovirga sp. MY04]
MKTILTLFILFLSTSIFAQIGVFDHEQKAVKKKDISQKKLESLTGQKYDYDKSIAILEKFMGYNKEGKTDYLYNYHTGEIELYLDNNFKTMEVMNYEITRELTNVYFIINDKLKLQGVYYNSSGETLDIRTYEKDKNSDKWNLVITDEDVKRLK